MGCGALRGPGEETWRPGVKVSTWRHRLDVALDAAAQHGGYATGFTPEYRKDFLRLWERHAGQGVLTIDPDSAQRWCADFTRKGYDWELSTEDKEFLDSFDGTGIPWLAFAIWGEDDDFENDEWRCLTQGGAPDRAQLAQRRRQRAKISRLLRSLLLVAARFEGYRDYDEKYQRTFRELWHRHGSGFHISPTAVRRFAEDMVASGYEDWRLEPSDSRTLEEVGNRGGRLPMLAFVLWCEDDEFDVNQWIPKPSEEVCSRSGPTPASDMSNAAQGRITLSRTSEDATS